MSICTIDLKVKWDDQYGIPRTVQRTVLDRNGADDWVDGWLAGVAEMVNWRGGHITEVLVNEVVRDIEWEVADE